MSYSLTKGQTAVLRAFYEFERPLDDVALAVYMHHMSTNQSSSSIRSRRAELSRPGKDGRPALITPIGVKKMKSGRNAGIYALTLSGAGLARTLFEAPVVIV